MSVVVFLAIALAGGVGAVARFVLDGAIKARVSTAFPIGTMVINVSGSLLLGLVTGLALGAVVTDDWRLILGTGFLGGYTTFSTASFETVRLVQTGKWVSSLVNGVGMLVLSVVAAGSGLVLGSQF